MKQHWLSGIIVVLFLLSLTFILFYIGWIPPLFGSSAHYKEINSVLLSFSLSYMAALVFYLLTFIIPKNLKQKEAELALRDRFEKIYDDLGFVIANLMLFAGINKDEKAIRKEDWNGITSNVSILQDAWYVREYACRDRVWESTYDRIWIDSEGELLRKIKDIGSTVATIYTSPFCTGLSGIIVDLLNQLSSSKGLQSLSSTIEFRVNILSLLTSTNASITLFNNPQEEFQQLVDIHLRLKPFCSKPIQKRYEMMTEPEKAQYLIDRDKIARSLNYVPSDKTQARFQRMRIF